jgi:AcrR family transcriptional regulator
MSRKASQSEGLRERKRRETSQRIAESGLKLFLANGYDATTLEAIAAEAGITKRTFFYYYKSKEEVLQVWLGQGFVAALHPALLKEPPTQAPITTVKTCILRLASLYETKESILVDRMFQSSETLQAKKQAIFLQMERLVFDALCRLYPQTKRQTELRTVAMVSIGAMRLAMESWRREEARKPLASYLRKEFEALALIRE